MYEASMLNMAPIHGHRAKEAMAIVPWPLMHNLTIKIMIFYGHVGLQELFHAIS